MMEKANKDKEISMRILSSEESKQYNDKKLIRIDTITYKPYKEKADIIKIGSEPKKGSLSNWHFANGPGINFNYIKRELISIGGYTIDDLQDIWEKNNLN